MKSKHVLLCQHQHCLTGLQIKPNDVACFSTDYDTWTWWPLLWFWPFSTKWRQNIVWTRRLTTLLECPGFLIKCAVTLVNHTIGRCESDVRVQNKTKTKLHNVIAKYAHTLAETHFVPPLGGLLFSRERERSKWWDCPVQLCSREAKVVRQISPRFLAPWIKPTLFPPIA